MKTSEKQITVVIAAMTLIVLTDSVQLSRATDDPMADYIAAKTKADESNNLMSVTYLVGLQRETAYNKRRKAMPAPKLTWGDGPKKTYKGYLASADNRALVGELAQDMAEDHDRAGVASYRAGIDLAIGNKLPAARLKMVDASTSYLRARDYYSYWTLDYTKAGQFLDQADYFYKSNK